MTTPVTTVHIGRQPIHDRGLTVVAYELRYRQTRAAPPDDAHAAQTFVTSMIDVGLERIAAGCPVVIRLPETLVRDGTLAHLPVERLILDLAPGQRPDRELEGILRSAVDAGLRLRLPDPIAHPEVAGLMDVASMVAVEVSPLTPDERRVRRASVARADTQVLAAGVDRHEVHDDCQTAGYDLFTGTVLSTPNVVSGRRLAAQPTTLLELVAQLHDPDVTLDTLEQTVTSDPQLAYQVLRYVNSAYVGLRQEVDSVRRAIALVGPPVLRQLMTMLLIQQATHKPVEASRVALVRAQMCAAIGAAVGDRRPAYHTVGLLSTVDLLTDVPLEDALHGLPLTAEVRDALLHHDGRLGRVLQAVKLYERCDWEDPVIASFDPMVLSEAYFRALAWADGVLAQAIEPAAA